LYVKAISISGGGAYIGSGIFEILAGFVWTIGALVPTPTQITAGTNAQIIADGTIGGSIIIPNIDTAGNLTITITGVAANPNILWWAKPDIY
jgi:hypothetical protein